MPPSLTEIRVFVTICDEGAFSRAASRLLMSPAMVTTHMARLEESLGARLLNRSTRRLEITERGRIFLDHARGILDALARAENAVRQTGSRPVGRVRIDGPAGLGSILLLPLLTQLRQLYPEVTIDLILTDRGVVHRPDGADILIRIGDPPQPVAHLVRLGVTRFPLAASPAYLAARGVPQVPEDLHQHDCILYSSREAPGGERWRLLKDGRILWIRPAPAFTSNNGLAMVHMAADGLGIVQGLWPLVAREIADGRLVPVLSELAIVEAPVVMICPDGERMGQAVRAVADFLTEHLSPPLTAIRTTAVQATGRG